MIRIIIGILVFSVIIQNARAEYKLIARTDHNDATYKVGEQVQFAVEVADGNGPVQSGSIKYKLTRDLEQVLSSGTIALGAESVTVKGKLDRPGFLNCEVEFEQGGSKLLTRAGAAVEPLELRPAIGMPDDFEKFWAEKISQLRKYPAKAFMRPVKNDEQGIEIFEIRIDCLDWMPVAGYFARPKNAHQKSCAAVLFLHGAGAFSASINSVTWAAKKGMIGLEINAHGIANGQPAEFYSDLGNGSLSMARYPYAGQSSRDTSYFLGMYLRLVRAMDFLMEQPLWDQKVLVTKGFSQGGAQAIAAAGLEPRVTAVAASAPALCDLTGEIVGWPHFVPCGQDGKADAKIAEVSRYFDIVNFARRTKARVILSVGFVDTICRPTSVYTAYNCLKGPKEMLTLPNSDHASPESVERAFLEMIEEHARSMRTGHS